MTLQALLSVRSVSPKVRAVFAVGSLALAAGCLFGLDFGRVAPLLIALVLSMFVLAAGLETIMLIWFLLSMAFQWWQGFELGAGLPSITVDRYFLLLGTLSLALHREHIRLPGRYGRWLLRVDSVYLLLAIFLILLRPVSLRAELLSWVSTALLPLVALFLGLQVKQDEVWWGRLVTCVPVMVLYLLIPAIYERVSSTPLISTSWYNGLLSTGGIRSPSLAGSPTTLSFSVVLLAPLTIYLVTQARSKLAVVGATLIFLGNLVTAFCAGYRTGWLALLVIFILSLRLLPRSRSFLLTFLMISIAIGIAMIGPLSSSTFVQERVLDPTNIVGRYDLIGMQFKNAAGSWLFGHNAYVAWSVDLTSRETVSSHNTFSTLLLYFGLTGLVLFVAVWVLAGLTGIRALGMQRCPEDGGERVAIFLLVLIGAFVTAMAHDNRFFVTGTIVQYFFIGLGIQRADEILERGSAADRARLVSSAVASTSSSGEI